MNGTSITTAAYDHQLKVSAPATVKPLIANASDYSACIAAVKSREARTEKVIKAEEENYAKKAKGRKTPRGLFGQGRKQPNDAQRKQQCETQYKAFKQQALSTLIRRMWIQLQAKELGVSVSDSEVASQVKTREASQKAIAKNSRAGAFGLSEAPHYSNAELVEMVKSQLLESHIYTKVREKFTKPGAVSDEKLEKYFNEHKQIYAEPERRMSTFALVKSHSVAEAIAKEHISGGLSAAAAKHGITATPSSFNCEQTHTKGVTLSPLYAAVCAAKTGVLSGPVNSSVSSAKAPVTYYVFEVKSITPASKPDFAKAKERIKQLLSSQGLEQGMFKYNEEIRTKQKEKTECAAGYVTPLCKEYRLPKPVSLPRVRPGRVAPVKPAK